MEPTSPDFAVAADADKRLDVSWDTRGTVGGSGGACVKTHRTHSVHWLTRGDDGVIEDAAGGGFCPDGYSLFKHGDEGWARSYGHQVADLLLSERGDLFEDIASDEVLLASFPYKYVPTAAANLVDHTLTRLNHILASRGKPTVGLLHAFKYPWQASVEHYFPTLDADSRREMLGNIRLSVDESRLQGARLVVVDDVRVTGATEEMFLEFLREIPGLKSLTVVYLAEVAPEVAAAGAAVEYEINHHKVTTLDHVASIVAVGDFRWNVRVAKFVLEQEDLVAFSDFSRTLPDNHLTDLYRAALLNEYHLEEKYANHLEILSTEMERRLLV